MRAHSCTQAITIIGLLINALEGKEPDLWKTREPYERFTHHNDRIDRSVKVEAAVNPDGELPVVVLSITTGGVEEAIEIRVEPSRLLYGVDRSAYIEVLSTAAAELADQEEEPESTIFEPTEKVHSAPETDRSPPMSVVTGYEGRFAMLRPGLESFLQSEGWSAAEAGEGEGDLVESLLTSMDQNLGLDWKDRELLQARLKVASRRLLVRFGFERQRAEEVAERFIAWLRIQVPDGEISSEQADVG